MKYIVPSVLLYVVAVAKAQEPVYAQCGGIEWAGETTCAAGSVCTYSNLYFSQCLPGAAPTSTSTKTTSSSSAVVNSTGTPSAIGPLGGVNTAGYSFGVVQNGSFTGTGSTPPVSQYAHFAAEVHKYLDSDNSGTHAECVTNNVAVLQTLVAWLQSNGNRQALLSETGGGNTASCETYLGEELAYVKANSASIVGFVIWAAGAFDTTYTLTVTPYANGTDQPLWIDAVIPNLP